MAVRGGVLAEWVPWVVLVLIGCAGVSISLQLQLSTKSMREVD